MNGFIMLPTWNVKSCQIELLYNINKRDSRWSVLGLVEHQQCPEAFDRASQREKSFFSKFANDKGPNCAHNESFYREFVEMPQEAPPEPQHSERFEAMEFCKIRERIACVKDAKIIINKDNQRYVSPMSNFLNS